MKLLYQSSMAGWKVWAPTLAAAILSTLHGCGAAEADRLIPLDSHLFHSLRRISLPVVSPDQQRALFATSYYDPDANKEYNYISILDIELGNTTQLTPAFEGSDRASNLLWLGPSTAGYLSKGALYQHDLAPHTNGTLLFNATQSINSATYRSSSGLLLFTASTLADGKISSVAKYLNEEKNRTDSAMVYNNLWARHWNKWMGDQKSTLFAINTTREAYGSWNLGREANLMQGLPPTKDQLLRWEVEGYTASEDGEHVAFVVRNPGPDMAWSTNVDIYLTAADGSRIPKLLTGTFKGAASSPTFSTDGSAVAWLQMETPGYESDINRIYVHNITTGNVYSVARTWDLSPQSILWSADNKVLYALTPDRGDRRLFSVEIATGKHQPLTGYGFVSNVARVGSSKLLVVYSNVTESSDIYTIDVGSSVSGLRGPMKRLTSINGDKLGGVYLSEAEDFWFTGALRDQVHGWILRPAGFNATKKYPLALLIHGGPQQASMHAFGLGQWNPNMYASAGYATVIINFHGSSSYGQKFTDSIHQQWGGYPYEDLMKGLDHVISTYSFVDASRMVALGGSYGGYMANWINANTDRFRALVAHDGQFNVVAGYYSTDELWFIEHDLGGVPFTTSGREKYDKYNPERLADKFKTPTLFIHGANDFRLTLEQSLAPWTLLRRKGIPSRLVYFPDEDHWVNKMGNSMRWYEEVFKWMAQWTSS
ncbi:Dipeptidyl-peptidase 5 [Coemansia spiralis]|uniref:Dipeptidyl-peptidase V n=1 Tax=Coemansia spiralis TaxID=417178 RepID=A0A9W8L233_9FUNG|nr:Dipeptidyl-peptidase 5 [Coemansia spiralis]